MIERVVSGGQTGVDRAALDVAVDLGVPIGGWVPRGRWAEDGRIPDRYEGLRETPDDDPTVRTDLNVRDAEATLVFTDGAPSGGTAGTVERAVARDRPVLVLDVGVAPTSEDAARDLALAWLRLHRPRVLNVAGPRASEAPALPPAVSRVLRAVLRETSRETDAAPELETERLLLRRWRGTDRRPFAAINADLAVTRFLPRALSPLESDAFMARIEAHFSAHGFGLWAAEERRSGMLAGFVGLAVPRFEASFTPCVEIGWRLAPAYWGQGLATEGARAALTFGFRMLELNEIVSFTVPANHRSRAVMERLGMSHDPSDDFDHPGLPAGHPLRRHVLYRVHRQGAGENS